MDYRYNAYGIGQRRQPNDASSFAPIRSSGVCGGGGGGSGIGNGGALDDNFRRTQSMNYGRQDTFNNSNDFNNQRYSDIDNKFGNMSSNNFGRSGGDSSGFTNYSSNNQRFVNNNHTNVVPTKNNFETNFRGSLQQQQPQQQLLDQRFNVSGDNSRNLTNSDFMPGSDQYRGSQNQLQQQLKQQMPSNFGLGRSINDVDYNNSDNKKVSIDNNQRFYNNDRNIDTFRRNDSFSDSNHMNRSGSNFKFNNDRAGPSFGRPCNSGNFGNFTDGGFNDDFRRPQSNDYPSNYDNKNTSSISNSNQQSFYNNNNNNTPSNIAGNNNGPSYRSPSNSGPPGDTMAVLETVNAFVKNRSNWQVGNNNFGFGPGKPNIGGNRNSKWNFDNNIGPKSNQAPIGNRPSFPNQQQGRGPRQAYNQNNNNNQNVARNKFPGNKAPQNQYQQPAQPQHQRPILKNPTNNKNPPAPVAKSASVNGGKPRPVKGPPKSNIAAESVAPNVQKNTQVKNIPINSNNKQPQPLPKTVVAKANPKVLGQKRVADTVAAPLTRADIKRRKLAIKRGFLLGGFKLPYINNQKVALPQPEDKSYAIMFFEQAPNYSTSGEELDDDAIAEYQESEQDGKNAGRTLVKRIRKRLHYEWAIREEAKKYTTWPTWWTDYKWCEEAIKKQLESFGSINLRNCFIPDLPRLTTEQVVDVIVSQAQFGLEKNSDNYFNNMKSIFTLMNVTFLENLKMPNLEKVQDMIRAVPNDFWTYKMRSMVYLWAQYLKISKTSSPSTETGVKELQAIARDWKNPLFHWIAKQAFDELKAISEVEWPEHKQQYPTLESTAPSS